MFTTQARDAVWGGVGAGARREGELGFGPRREPESASLECAGAWRLPVSPWSGKVSGGAASATRSHGGPRLGAGRASGRYRGPLKRRHPRRSPLGCGILGSPPSPPLAPQPPGRGGEASWPARASSGAPALAAAVHPEQPAPRSARSLRPRRPARSRRSPPPSYIGPSSIPLSRSARAPGPKEKDQGQEGQSPKEVSLVPQQTALCVSSGTSSSYRVVRLGRARGSGGSPQPLPATWLLGRCVIRPPGTMWKVAGSLGSGLQERPGACPAPLPNSIEEAQMWAGGRSWQSLPGCM